MRNYVNYFLSKKHSKLTQGHLKSCNLYDKILNHNGDTAYCCYFDLDNDYLKLEWDTNKKDTEGKSIYEYHLSGQTPSNPEFKCNGKTFTQYEGIARPALNMVSFDFDADDPADALYDVDNFIKWLKLNNNQYVLFFSGNKGFHLMIPFSLFPLEANEHLPNQLKDLAKHLKDDFPTLDDSIYNYNRKFRVPFTKHEKSGLYKNVVRLGELDNILEECEEPHCYDFMQYVEMENETSEVLVSEYEKVLRKSYEIEKEKAGTLVKPSPFEKYDGKICITKMLESRCDDIGRNNAALRIVNDYFRTGKTQKACERDLSTWASENDLPLSELTAIINNIYERHNNYNFGCQDECKSIYCSAKCTIWKKLDPEKRPTTVDMPANAESPTKLNNEFIGVRWLMENIFGADFDEDSETFSSGLIVKQDAVNLFYYKDKHWQFLDEAKIHILKTKLNSKYKNKLSIRKLDSVFKMFTLYVPEKPEDVDLFAPRNDMANFLDGTLHLERNKNNEYQLVFKEHDKSDFCTTIIEQKYSDYLHDTSRRNDDFEDWLYEYLEEDKESFDLVQQMFGASLMPKFPQFFVLLGKTSTGKSTTIKILKQLHKNDKNISGVSPDKFHGFHMTSMIGKLMNIVSDIKTNCRIDDDIVKQVDDQDIVRIEIKKRDDVYTKLPALHIFGANKMPITGEGYSGAMKRRFSIINFSKQYNGRPNTEIAKDLFNNDPLGVLTFALNGLKKLAVDNNGEYTKTIKSQENVDKWSKKDDCIWSFINSIIEEPIDVDGHITSVFLDKEEKILRSKIWKMFATWQQTYLDSKNQMGKMSFLNAMNDAGFTTKNTNKGFHISGIGESIESSDSI